ncbi:MAG: helix-turn-helix transcriptional regulator [Betaproteobacteria bacterium]
MNEAVTASKPAAHTEQFAAGDREFLASVGRRVRERRVQRGMTRKLLAHSAEVSERYLGQLETGEGNISILLLRRIALALTSPLAELLTPGHADPDRDRIVALVSGIPAHRRGDLLARLAGEFGEADPSRQSRVALIGLRGAGKSTLGLALANARGIPFIELNQEVERETGLPASEVFDLYGQAGYRRIERRCLERVLTEHPRAVLSLGGGVVSEGETFALLLRHCRTVWLKASPEEHMARVLAQGDLRPMSGHDDAMEDLKRILVAREPLYRNAELIVDTTGKTPAESLRALREATGA